MIEPTKKKSLLIWITGLSGSGKTTLANKLADEFRRSGILPVLLDGDTIRDTLKGFKSGNDPYSRDSRLIYAQTYSRLAKTFVEQGHIVIVSTISMFDEIYIWNRNNISNYFEIYIHAELDELYIKDPKSIYANYEKGTLNSVVGGDLSYDVPENSDFTFNRSQPRENEFESLLLSLKSFGCTF